MNTRIGCEGRVVRIDEVIGRLGSAAGPDFRVAVRAQGVVLLRLGLALIDLVRFMQRRRVRTASAHLSVPVAIRLQSDGIYLFYTNEWNLNNLFHRFFFFHFFSKRYLNQRNSLSFILKLCWICVNLQCEWPDETKQGGTSSRIVKWWFFDWYYLRDIK